MEELAHVAAVAFGVVGVGLLLALISGVTLRRSRARKHRKVAKAQRRDDTRIALAVGETEDSRRRRRRKRPPAPKIDLFATRSDEPEA